MPQPQSTANRRVFLARNLFAATALAAPGIRAGAADAPDPIKLVPRPEDLMRVRIEMDVKGNVKVSDNALASKETKQQFPITSKATLDYEERALRPENASETSEIVASERFYHTATSTSLLNKSSTQQDLRPELRHVKVRRETLPETLYSDENFFTHGELSLLKSPVSSVSPHLLLPPDAVAQGDRYEILPDNIASVLNLSSVDSGKLDATVAGIDDQKVRIELKGEIEGSVEGVTTRLRLVGKMTYDRNFRTCTWLALAIHETREIGRAMPGFDVTATIRIIRRPMEKPVGLPAAASRIAFDQPVPAGRLYVELQSRPMKVGTMMNRGWRMINDTPRSAILRMVRDDISIAQCNLRTLVPLPEGKELSMEKFAAGVAQSLGDQLGQITEQDQRVSAQGMRVLRVVATGETQGVSIRWIMMHFSDDTGRRMQATFTMSADQTRSFAASDAQFADSFRFLDATDLHDRKSAPAESISGQAGESARVAGLPSELQADDESAVSASDLR